MNNEPYTLMKFFSDVAVPVFIGVIASWVNLVILIRLKPKIEISSVISKFTSNLPDKKYGYAIKIINRTKQPSIDIKARLVVAKQKQVSGGHITRTTDFRLEKDSQFEMPGYKAKKPEESAFRFLTYENIEKHWDDTKDHIEFILYAKHSVSNFGKVFTQTYRLKRESLKEGSFAQGDSMKIV